MDLKTATKLLKYSPSDVQRVRYVVEYANHNTDNPSEYIDVHTHSTAQKEIAQIFVETANAATLNMKPSDASPKIDTVKEKETTVDPQCENQKTIKAKPSGASAKTEEVEHIEEKKGLYANIHAKRARGESPAKPGDEDYPAKDAFKKAAKTAKEEVEHLDELSNKTLGGYVAKASKEVEGHMKYKGDNPDVKKIKDTQIKKRVGGMAKAGAKMAEAYAAVYEKYDNRYSDNTGEESAKKKAALEKKRGMKLDNHPQFKREEVEHIEEQKPPRTAKGAMAYDGPNKAASEARDRIIAKTKALRKKKGIKPTVNIDAPDRLVSLKIKEAVANYNEELKMTKKEYAKIHKDFKSDDPKNPRTTKYVPGKGTVSMPVTFTDEYVPEGNEMADKQSLSAKTLRRTKPVSKSELAQNQMKSTTRRNKPGTGGDEGSGIYDMSNIGRTSYSGHGEDSIEVSGPGQGKPKVGKVKSYKVDPKTLKDEYVPEGKEKLVYGDFGNYTKNQKVDKKKEKKLKEPPYEALASDYAPDMSMVEDMSGMSQKSGDKRSTESGAGMTAKGVAKYNRRTGGNLKTAVTTPPSKLKPGSKAANRRKSFCARSKGWTGERGKAARRRWNCNNGFEPENGEMINEYKTMLDTIKRKVSVLGGKSNKKSKSDYVGKKDAGAIAKKVLQQKQHKKYVNFLYIDEEKKQCGEGEYYCNDDKKWKPIPKGYKIGYGGYLKPENEKDESNGKKGGSNGNGNGHGGNGNGHGGNGNGGNGGGNGGGEQS